MQQQPMMPFDEGAKFRHVQDRILSDKLEGYKPGGTSTMPLRKVGLTMALLVQVKFNLTNVSGTPVLTEEGLYGMINRVQVIIGNNQAQPIDLNAAGLRHVQRVCGFQQWGGFDTPSMGQVIANTNLHLPAIGGTGATTPIIFTFLVPFSANLHSDRHLGVLPTAARGFTANLQIDWAKLDEFVTGGVISVSGATAEVETLTLDVPDFHMVAKPKFWVFARRSTTIGKVQPGENKIEIPQGGILLSIGGIVKANGLRTDKINAIGLVLDGNDQPMTEKLWVNKANFAARHSLNLPAGEFVYNLLEGSNEGFSGSYRDTFDTTRLGLLELLVDVDPTADLSTNPAKNNITMVRTTQHPINVAL